MACGIPSLPNALLFQSKHPLYPTLEVKGNVYYYLIDLHFCLTQKTDLLQFVYFVMKKGPSKATLKTDLNELKRFLQEWQHYTLKHFYARNFTHQHTQMAFYKM